MLSNGPILAFNQQDYSVVLASMEHVDQGALGGLGKVTTGAAQPAQDKTTVLAA